MRRPPATLSAGMSSPGAAFVPPPLPISDGFDLPFYNGYAIDVAVLLAAYALTCVSFPLSLSLFVHPESRVPTSALFLFLFHERSALRPPSCRPPIMNSNLMLMLMLILVSLHYTEH